MSSRRDKGVLVVVIVWLLDLQLHVQSVPISTKVMSSNLDQSEVYNIIVIKFVSVLQQVGGFLRVLRSSTNKADRHDITEILLKLPLRTINQQNHQPRRDHNVVSIVVAILLVFL